MNQQDLDCTVHHLDVPMGVGSRPGSARCGSRARRPAGRANGAGTLRQQMAAPFAKTDPREAAQAQVQQRYQQMLATRQGGGQPMPQQGMQPPIGTAAGSGMAVLRASGNSSMRQSQNASNSSIGGAYPPAASGPPPPPAQQRQQAAEERKYHLDPQAMAMGQQAAAGAGGGGAFGPGAAGRLAAENQVLRDELRRLPEELMRSTRHDLQRLESRVNALVKENKGLTAEVERARESVRVTEETKAQDLVSARKDEREAALAEAQESHDADMAQHREEMATREAKLDAAADRRREKELGDAARAAEAEKKAAIQEQIAKAADEMEYAQAEALRQKEAAVELARAEAAEEARLQMERELVVRVAEKTSELQKQLEITQQNAADDLRA